MHLSILGLHPASAQTPNASTAIPAADASQRPVLPIPRIKSTSACGRANERPAHDNINNAVK